jgi:hypothetical protein
LSAVRRLVFGPETLAQLRAAAEAAESELLWLLDEDAEPDSATLPALLEAGHVPVASLPLGAAGGEPLEAAVGRFATAEPAALLEAAQARYVPLRHAFLTSLLVARASVLELDPPDPARFGRWAGSEWTARLFARHPGRLVPASTVRVRPPARDREPLAALRAARAAQWGRGETLRALYGSLTR